MNDKRVTGAGPQLVPPGGGEGGGINTVGGRKGRGGEKSAEADL